MNLLAGVLPCFVDTSQLGSFDLRTSLPSECSTAPRQLSGLAVALTHRSMMRNYERKRGGGGTRLSFAELLRERSSGACSDNSVMQCNASWNLLARGASNRPHWH